MNRLVCLGWISKPERKDNFLRDAGGTTQNPAQTPTALLNIVIDAAVTQWLLATNANAQRNAFHRGGRPQRRLQPLELDIEVDRRNNVGEIDCHSNVAAWVRMSDDAVILVDELPKRQD